MSEDKYFKRLIFTEEQLDSYIKNAFKDLKIAKDNPTPEVKFTYSYNALLKSGIALIAGVKNLKVRSVPGHHIKILEDMSKILEDNSIFDTGNAMRMKRNTDLYDGGIFISEKESMDYYEFVEETVKKVKAIIKTK